jgi:hypothetical protein
MNGQDRRVAEITRILCALRTAAGLPPDYRGCVMAAFAATETDLEELHAAIGRVIGMCDKQAIAAAIHPANRSR